MRIPLWPQSLFGRLLSALLAAIGVTLLVIVALIIRERRELSFWGSETAEVVELLEATAGSLADLLPAERAQELERLRASPLAVDRDDERRRPPPPQPSLTASAAALRARLARQLPSGFDVSVRSADRTTDAVIRVGRVRPEPFRGDPGGPPRGGDGQGGPRPSGGPGGDPGGPGGPGGEARGPGRGGPGGPARQFDVAITLPDGDIVTFRTDVPRAPPPLPRQIFVELALVTIMLAVVLYLMARTITRPLADLSTAAEAIGHGAQHVPLRETGAREVREATRAFNAMQERLHRYLDSRTRVLAAMSHDLRTPLTRLKLRVESLDDEKERERFTSDLDEMSAMINGALNLFRGLNADEPVQPVPLDALLAELRREFAVLGAEVVIDSRVREPILARPQALKRCLTNLVSNAVKYGVSAKVVAKHDGAELVVRVLDEGPGIPEDKLEQVFEPFYRLESSRNTDTGGTGLGLSIARDIAQAHGGSVVLRNRSPRGLEAVLTLPGAAAS